MKIKLTEDTQDMIISLERIDVDYRRVSPETSLRIVNFMRETVPKLSPRALTVIVKDIETERERYERMNAVHKTIANWKEIEELAISILNDKFGILTRRAGLYTDFIYDVDKYCYRNNAEIEMEEDKFSEFLKAGFIYALGRRSYVVGSTIDYILDYKHVLTEKDKKYMREKVEELRKQYDKELADEHHYYDYEGVCVNEWVNFANKL